MAVPEPDPNGGKHAFKTMRSREYTGHKKKVGLNDQDR